MNDFSKLDFSSDRNILLCCEDYLGLKILLVAHEYGEVDLGVLAENGRLVANQEYHFRDWERLGTEGIVEYWKGQIYSGEIWEQ